MVLYACKVCGADAENNKKRYGVIACSCCSSFFRCNNHHKWTKCRRKCEINVETRAKCKYCRLFKCRNVGMRKIDVSHIEDDEIEYMEHADSEEGTSIRRSPLSDISTPMDSQVNHSPATPPIVMTMVDSIANAYKSKCRYFEMKESRNTLTLNRLHFDSTKDPEEVKRKRNLLFFEVYSHDIENIFSFLDSVPFLNRLSRTYKIAKFKKNSFSIWAVWCLYGIGNEKLILPSGRYLDRKVLRSVFRSKVLDKFFNIPFDFIRLDLDPTEISYLILFLFFESAEVTVDVILMRENRREVLTGLKKIIKDLKKLNEMVKRSIRMSNIIDEIECLK